MKFSVLQLNIERSRHVEVVTKLLQKKKPDIVCFQEAMLTDIKKMAADLGYQFVFAPMIILNNGKTADQEGPAILSKLPIKSWKEYRYDRFRLKEIPAYTEEEIASKNGKRPKIKIMYKILTISVLNNDGQEITIATTHFPVADHGSPGLNDHELRDTDSLRAIILSSNYLDDFISILKTLKNPLILTGDLNNTRGEYVYDRISQELIDIIPSAVVSTLDPKLHRVRNLELAVDAFMVSHNFATVDFKVIEGVSDHKALMASLQLDLKDKKFSRLFDKLNKLFRKL